MNIRILASGVVLALAAVSQAAVAGHYPYERYDDRGPPGDYARVVAVEPLMERVRYTAPVQDCWVETVDRGSYRPDPAGAAIVGGAVGALIGNSLGHGDGRAAATVGGAMIGAVVGHQAARNAGGVAAYQDVRRCATRYEERFDERVAGYRVTYEYNGRRAVTRLPYDPGRYLRVSVDVRPWG